MACFRLFLFVLTTPGMPVVALLPQGRFSQGATQSIPGLRLNCLFVCSWTLEAEETQCHIATSPLVDHSGDRRPGHSLLGEMPFVTTLKCWWLFT